MFAIILDTQLACKFTSKNIKRQKHQIVASQSMHIDPTYKT